MKKRTSLSMAENAIELAKRRSDELGYDSVSEYIEHLILQDDEEKRAHITIRSKNCVQHKTEASE